MANLIMIGSIVITAMATAVIAWYAVTSNKLSSKISLRDDEFRHHVSDLYHAMVISNLLSSDSGLDKRFNLFKQNYQGETPISLTLKRSR